MANIEPKFDDLSKEEIEIMAYTVGADTNDPGGRNYYCAEPDDEIINGLIKKGFMKQLESRWNKYVYVVQAKLFIEWYKERIPGVGK